MLRHAPTATSSSFCTVPCARSRFARTSLISSRASATDDASSQASLSVARVAALTALPASVVEQLLARDDAPDPRTLVKRMILLRHLLPRADCAHMVSIEPRLLTETEEFVEFAARDALETLRAFIAWPNVLEFIVQEEPSLLLGLNGQMRLVELRDAAEYYRENLVAVAGDGKSWLSVGAQRYVSNFFVQYY